MEKREEVKEFLLSKCKILNTYSWSDDRKAYDVPKYVLSDSKTLKLIDKIFNDHEAQLKKCIELGEKQALEFDRFFDAFGLKSENISIDDAINFFKAKDEITQDIKEAYELKSIAYDLLLEAIKLKDEEIKVLECRAYHAEGYISDLHNNPKDKKFYDKKARSIVAMLFWEWRKHHRMYYESSKARNPSALTHLNSATLSKLMFKQAYKMSKDIK